MGTVNCQVRLESLDGERSVETEALVDTGAFFTLVPAKLLSGLGVEPFDTQAFELADGRLVEYDIGQVVATVDGRTVTTLTLFGNDDVEPLLGVYALEGLRLAVDPVNAQLVPLKFRAVTQNINLTPVSRGRA